MENCHHRCSILNPRDLVEPVKSRMLIGIRVRGNHKVGLAVDLANLWMEFYRKMLVPRGQRFSQPKVSQLRYIRAYLKGSVRRLRADRGWFSPALTQILTQSIAHSPPLTPVARRSRGAHLKAHLGSAHPTICRT